MVLNLIFWVLLFLRVDMDMDCVLPTNRLTELTYRRVHLISLLDQGTSEAIPLT